MMRLPRFTLHRPKTAQDAVKIAREHGDEARYVAGGTDLWPNMKRRHQKASHVIALGGLPELRGIQGTPDGGFTIGAMTTLTALEKAPLLRERHPAFHTAVAAISTPLLRNMGTIGGNVLLDTRCNYYDQSYEWRESVHFCMKCDGDTCWVAPSSPRCWAVQSSDSVPVLCAIGAEVSLVGEDGERRIPIEQLYRDDGIDYVTKKRSDLLTAVHLPAHDGWTASYRKLRRRGTFDFPVLGVAVWLKQNGDVIEDVRIRIGGAGSAPLAATQAEDLLRGHKLTDDLLTEAAQTAYKPTRAMDNTDHDAPWRKKMAPVFVERTVRDCLG